MQIKIFVVGPIDNNSIVIYSEETKKAAVIDPGFHSFKKILKFLKEENLQLEMILLTHSHWDHIADVKKLKDEFSCSVLVHKLDAKNVESPGSDRVFGMFKIHGVKPDILLEDNQVIQLGDIDLRVIHTPGHTPGGVCYYSEKEKTLFSGDTLFKGSHGRTDLETADPNLMVDSLKKLSKLPKETIVIPGHGKKTTIEDENWLARAEEFI